MEAAAQPGPLPPPVPVVSDDDVLPPVPLVVEYAEPGASL
jgi:hypothetical protein